MVGLVVTNGGTGSHTWQKWATCVGMVVPHCWLGSHTQWADSHTW